MFLKYFPYRSVVYFLQKCFYMHVDKQVYAISKKRFLKGSPIFIKIFTFSSCNFLATSTFSTSSKGKISTYTQKQWENQSFLL